MKYSLESFKKMVLLKKKEMIILVIIITIVSIGAFSYFKSKQVSGKQFSVSKVLKSNITASSTVTGKIESNYRNDIVLNSTQKVLKIYINEGDQVKKGDLLVQLDSTDFENQLEKEKLNLANANLILREYSGTGILAEKSASQNAFIQAKSTLENSQRNYEDLSKKYDQSNTLFEQGYISRNEYDSAKKAMEDGASALNNAKASLNNAEISFNSINNTSNNKILTQRNQIALIEKNIDSLNKKIGDSLIKSNIDGKVTKIDAKENQFPNNGDSIIVDDLSQNRIRVDLSQNDALKVAIGQKTNIKIKGLNNTYSGVVTEIGQLAQKENSNGATEQEYKVKVIVTMDKADEKIKAGYDSEVQFIFDEKPSALVIGFDSIRQDKSSGKKYVYSIDSNSKVSKKYITTGIESDYYVELKDGLKEGEKYILNPTEDLKEGDFVSESSVNMK